MSLASRPLRVFAMVILAVSIMVLAVLVPSHDADAVDGPVPVVFIARSDDFADALSGGPLAALNGAPLLLTNTSSLAPDTADELERLDPERIVILGGPVAISAATETQLEALAGAGGVDRIAGENRFETAALIAAALPNKAADADLLDGMDSTDFVPTEMAEPFIVQLDLDTFVVLAENGPLTVAAFCDDSGDGTPTMSMRVSSTVAGAFNEDDTGPFGPGDGFVDLNDPVTPGPAEYENEIDEGVAIARADGVLYVVSVDGEINGFGETIYGEACTINGIVNSYSGPAGPTDGASPVP